MSSYVLLQTELGAAGAVAASAASMTGVQLVHDVAGPYDVVVVVDPRHEEAVVARLRRLSEVSRALTCSPAALAE
ncbi:MAG: Lrp/AsnC family transcriptional regulator [Mycobacteriales bacterium]